MISKLIETFNKNHKFFLYSIGSKNINKFTFKEVTLRRILKKRMLNLNKREFDKYIIKDNKISSLKNSSFYCLVILSNMQIREILKNEDIIYCTAFSHESYYLIKNLNKKDQIFYFFI